MPFFAPNSEALAQTKKADKPTGQSGSAKAGSAVATGIRTVLPSPGTVQRVFAIKHAEVDAIGRTLRIFPIDVRENKELRVIAISGPAALIPTIEDTIRRLDVPPPTPQNVELTVYVLLASDQEGSVPAELESVVKQLRTTFGFKGVRPVDTIVVRSRDTRPGQVSGLSRLDPEIPNPSTYSLIYAGASINSDEKGRSIRLNGLRFSAKIVVKSQQVEGGANVGYTWIDAGFGTDVDVREGQKVVVGKAAVGSTNSALILVITAKVLE